MMSINLNVGQCVSPPRSSAGNPPGGAGETRCPTLTSTRFRGSKRELLVRGILSPRGRGEGEQSSRRFHGVRRTESAAEGGCIPRLQKCPGDGRQGGGGGEPR